MFVRKATISELGAVKTNLTSAQSVLETLESVDSDTQELIEQAGNALDDLLGALERQMNPVDAEALDTVPAVLDPS